MCSPEKFLQIIFFKNGGCNFLSRPMMQTPADCNAAEVFGTKCEWHMCQHVLAAGMMRRRPCNWPWLHITTRSNAVTMRSIFVMTGSQCSCPVILILHVDGAIAQCMPLVTSTAHTELKLVELTAHTYNRWYLQNFTVLPLLGWGCMGLRGGGYIFHFGPGQKKF